MKNSKFIFRIKQMYLFISQAKVTMCLFYAYMMFMYLFLAWVSDAPVQSIDLPTTFQMFCCCLLIGFAQRIVVPSENVTPQRAVIWAAISFLSIALFDYFFGWFAGFPIWTQVIFWGFIVVGSATMTLHLHISLKVETELLNHQLKAFQNSGERQKGN